MHVSAVQSRFGLREIACAHLSIPGASLVRPAVVPIEVNDSVSIRRSHQQFARAPGSHRAPPVPALNNQPLEGLSIGPHYEDYRGLLSIDTSDDLRAMKADHVLSALISGGLKLSAEWAKYVAQHYVDLVSRPILPLETTLASPEMARRIIILHRRILRSDEYVKSRIKDPSAGTMDHVHAEVVADVAARLAGAAGYGAEVVELVRLAGHLHDSDRSFPLLTTPNEQEARAKTDTYWRFKIAHMLNSVARTKDLVMLARLDGGVMHLSLERDLCYLVGRHEIGGKQRKDPTAPHAMSRLDPTVSLDKLTDILQDADVMAFFHLSLPSYWNETEGDLSRFMKKITVNYVDRLSNDRRRHVVAEVLNSPTHPLGTRAEKSKDGDVQSIRKAMRALVESQRRIELQSQAERSPEAA